MTRAIVFDLDDTLYAEREYVYSGFAAVAADLARDFPERTDLASRLRTLFAEAPRSPVLDRLAAELSPHRARELVDRMLEVYRSHRPQVRLFDDAAACLEACAAVGKLALISDGRLAGQQAKLEALGIADRFACVVLTDRWGKEFWKPHPRAFEHVERQLGCSPSNCVYVADNPAKDFEAPDERGWHTVRVNHPQALGLNREEATRKDARHQIIRLRELPPLLRRLWPAGGGGSWDHVE